MDKESIFFTLFLIWFINKVGIQNVFIMLNRFHQHATDFLNYYNTHLYPMYFSQQSEIKDESQEQVKEEDTPKPEIKYEDKFLEDIRKMNKEYVFNDDEKFEEGQKFIELFNKASDERVYQINLINDKMAQIEIKLTKYEGESDYCICDDDEEDIGLGETKEDRINTLVKQQIELSNEKKKLVELFESQKYIEEDLIKLKDEAKQFVIDKRLEKLENCHVMESTPLGNVLMKYDKNKESFRFYSDSTIPYRYLEVVGRKFVKQFNCRPIFVDMEEELKLAEEKWEKERKEKEEKEEEEKRRKEEAAKNKTIVEEKKKNVFAKFKSYNKESGTGHVTTAAPPKNSIPNKKLTQAQENEKILLKQKANRYTYEGKIANFSFIKKIDRKVVDKKFGMSFADFKKSILKK